MHETLTGFDEWYKQRTMEEVENDGRISPHPDEQRKIIQEMLDQTLLEPKTFFNNLPPQGTYFELIENLKQHISQTESLGDNRAEGK